MDWLKKILGGDPYKNSAIHFTRRGTFSGVTACGYKIRYDVTCHYDKSDSHQFKSARMLEEENADKFLALVNERVVAPASKSNGRQWRLLLSRFGGIGGGELCRVVKDESGVHVYRDQSCVELNKELSTARFEDLGCSATSIIVYPREQSPEIIEENYKRMIPMHDGNSIKHTPQYMALEESIIVLAARRELEVQKVSLQRQAVQSHKAELFAIETRLVGRALEITWTILKPLGSSALYGYAKQGGFWTGTRPLESNGTCVVEARNSGSSIMDLAAGVQHYLTFVVARNQLKEWDVLETLRFSVRVPALNELTHVDELLKALDNHRRQQAPALNEKTTAALNELRSFVEFEETISGVEKELIDQISGKGYSPEEKADKIERIKAVAESLRMST